MVFSKLRNLDPEEEEAKLSSVAEDEALEVELRMTVTTSKEKVVDSEASDTPEGHTEVGVNDVQPTVAPQLKRPECKCKFLYSILLQSSYEIQMDFLQFLSSYVS